MDKKDQKKIRDLILNKKIGSIDKLIAIYKIVDDSEDMKALSDSLEISELFLEQWEIKEIPKDLKPTKSILSEFIDVFSEYHVKIHSRSFDYDKKEIGQLKNCVKKFKDLETWRHLMILAEQAYLRKERGEIVVSTWNFIIQNLKPSTIYNQRNFILNEEARIGKLLDKQPKKKKEWNW